MFYLVCTRSGGCLPVRASLGHFLGRTLRSWSGTTTPSIFPNMVDSPRQNSMMKNSMDQRGDTGILVIASVNTMKARPVPSTPCGTETHAELMHSTERHTMLTHSTESHSMLTHSIETQAMLTHSTETHYASTLHKLTVC